MKNFTEAAARKAGYELHRGSYSGTSTNRIDRWYWERVDADVVDRNGTGYATKREALEALNENLALDTAYASEWESTVNEWALETES